MAIVGIGVIYGGVRRVAVLPLFGLGYRTPTFQDMCDCEEFAIIRGDQRR